MIATSLSTQSCPTGYCGQCGPCRREMREADRLMIPKALPPIELSPTAQQLLAEPRRERERRTRRPIPKVQNRRATTATPYVRPSRAKNTATPSPCTECGEMRGYKICGGRGHGRTLDAVGNLCTVCADKPKLTAQIAALEANPTRTKAEHNTLSRARIRLRRITRNGRPYHPEAPHGTSNAYASYQCRCDECRAYKTEQDSAARAKNR